MGAVVFSIKMLETSNTEILPLLISSNLCILLFSPLDSQEKPLDAEDRRKYRKICYGLLIVWDAVATAAALLTLPVLYYPVACGMFLEAVLLSIGKLCNRKKYEPA